MALLEQDVFLVIGDAAGSGLTSSALGGGGGRGTVPFLCVAPLSYPQPGLRRFQDDDDDRDDDDSGGGGGGGGCRRPFRIVPYTCTFVQYIRTFGAPD